MSQKWYQKASVQASIVGGVFLITAAIISGLFIVFDHDSAKPNKKDLPQRDSAVVTSVSPNEGTQGERLNVTIKGQGFQHGASSKFESGITVDSTNFISETELRANISIEGGADPGSRTVMVTNPDEQSGKLQNAFTVGLSEYPSASTVVTVSPPPAAIVTLSPTPIKINVGETNTVTATVTRDGDPQAGVRVAFAISNESVANISPPSAVTNEAGEAQASITSVSEGNTRVIARVEGDSTSVNLTVSNGIGPPTVVDVDPDNGRRDRRLNVTINGANFQSGASSNFGADITVNSTNFISSTRLTVNISIAAAAVPWSRTVTVTNPDNLSDSLVDAFEVLRTIQIIGTFSGGPNIWEVDGQSVSGNPPPPITVSAGDKIEWKVGQGVHGVVFDNKTEGEVKQFLSFESIMNPVDNPRGFPGWGNEHLSAGTLLVRATVRPGQAGNQLLFFCTQHGRPMNGVLQFE